MVAFITFDAYASAYEINGELYYLKSKPEVESVRLLSRKEGEASKYCLEITAADSADEMIKKEVERAKSMYSSEISNVKLVTYSTV